MSRPRKVRKDAEANRERLLSAAAAAMLREGRHVPLATIAAEAGLGIGTLYRSYADRDALLQALEHRAYGLLNNLLDQIDDDSTGLEQVRRYLEGTVDIADQLVLPLHGAPPLVTPEAVAARKSIYRRLEFFLATGREDGSIRGPVNATDLIAFSTLLTQPKASVLDWTHLARRQIAHFLNGLAAEGPIEVPGPAVERDEVERAFEDRMNS
ncbi:TetR/AcrR family transcriptional regulator [Amycolatopsis dendrobii]|uniref:TetR/AcrR family transcriptional regulator n=1 Tax=Amycolatopsis dendrobii TaxID=2760662 RepID=A0A7W3Z921_9PSEU|nr:TetR/AcrR family transcriptional regulator [Amycolatopsis dendrobii]MBB1152412.1 TetR/AcrR family transcriptional regulator [Amycolatopsis dendrobii]